MFDVVVTKEVRMNLFLPSVSLCRVEVLGIRRLMNFAVA
jgi:hypothetical protein